MTKQERPRGGAPLGNTNAAKPPEQRRRTISIRLPPELLERLAEEPDKTALIERLLRRYYDRQGEDNGKA